MKNKPTTRWIAGLTAASSIVASFGATAAGGAADARPVVTGVGNGDLVSLSSLDLGVDLPGASANVVEWRLDGAKVARDSTAPFEQTVDISTLGDGEHQLFTKVKINGTWHTSKTVRFVVGTSAPEVDPEPPADDTDAMAGHDGMGDHGAMGAPGAWLAATDETVDVNVDQRPHDYAVFDYLDAPPSVWGRERIGFLLSCSSVAHEQFDPIVSPGQASAHLHEFFGNTSAAGPNLSTQQLIDSDSNCSDPNDRSSSWSPAASQDGELLTAKELLVYYKSPADVDQPIPLGLRMIAGDAGATENQPQKIGGWTAEGHLGGTLNTFGDDEMFTHPNAEFGRINMRINYPFCWDGLHLDSPDHKSHMSYGDGPSYRDPGNCPSTHPVRLPQLVTFTTYKAAAGEGLSLASGDWFTFHQDYWNGFHSEQFQALVDECITTAVNCRTETQQRLVPMGQYMKTIGSTPAG